MNFKCFNTMRKGLFASEKKANGKWRKAHMYVSRVLNIATLSS